MASSMSSSSSFSRTTSCQTLPTGPLASLNEREDMGRHTGLQRMAVRFLLTKSMMVFTTWG